MLNKRGVGSAIDWILAFGLFLIGVVFVFVIFRPGVTPVYDAQTLLNIVQDGFENESFWEITKVPVFIAPGNATYVSSPGPRNVKLTSRTLNLDTGETVASGETRLEALFAERNKFNVEVFYLRRTESDNPIFGSSRAGDEDTFFDVTVRGRPEEINSPGREENVEDIDEGRRHYSGREEADRDGALKYNLSDDTIIIPAYLRYNNKTKYLITTATRALNFETSDLTGTNVLEGCSVLGEFNPAAREATIRDNANQCQAVYGFGAIEKVSGIYLPSFIGLSETGPDITDTSCSQGYDCIKSKWNFPINKEFKISIKGLPVSGEEEPILDFPSNLVEPQNINVFVRRFNDFVLSDDGTRIPVVVEIKTW